MMPPYVAIVGRHLPRLPALAQPLVAPGGHRAMDRVQASVTRCSRGEATIRVGGSQSRPRSRSRSFLFEFETRTVSDAAERLAEFSPFWILPRSAGRMKSAASRFIIIGLWRRRSAHLLRPRAADNRNGPIPREDAPGVIAGHASRLVLGETARPRNTSTA